MADYNIRDFGAVGDGSTPDTAAIQSAIDTCYDAGGGRVIVPAGGVYLSGSIFLKSNVELHVERGGVLEASGKEADFQHMRVAKAQMPNVYPNINESIAFIIAYNAVRIAVTGGGIIDGGGHKFIIEKLPHIYRMKQVRPFTFFFIGCVNVDFRDVTIRDGALWTVRLSGCEDILMNGMRILNDLKLPNCDGIDLDHCRNARIIGCHIVCGDDCICLKTCDNVGDFGACENITVFDCTLVSTSTALNVGCEARAPMRNIIFDSCVVQSSNRGLGVHISHHADIENILFTNMVVETRLFHHDWWGRAEPIYICLVPWTAEDEIGQVRQIRFQNILCKGENGVFVYASEPGHLRDILFENVRVELNKQTKIDAGQWDIRPGVGEGMPEHAYSGFYIENADEVTLRHCSVAWGENRVSAYRYALEAINVGGLTLDDFKGDAAHPETDQAVRIVP